MVTNVDTKDVSWCRPGTEAPVPVAFQWKPWSGHSTSLSFNPLLLSGIKMSAWQDWREE